MAHRVVGTLCVLILITFSITKAGIYEVTVTLMGNITLKVTFSAEI
jgi:hypothetical protein